MQQSEYPCDVCVWLSVWIPEIFVMHGTIFIQSSLEMESHAQNFLLLCCHTWFLHSSCVIPGSVTTVQPLSWQQEQELCSLLSVWVINMHFWELLNVSLCIIPGWESPSVYLAFVCLVLMVQQNCCSQICEIIWDVGERGLKTNMYFNGQRMPFPTCQSHSLL